MFQLLVEQGTAKDILNFRLMFEQAFTVMAMEQASDEDIEHIHNTLKRFELTIKKALPNAEDDLAFHYAILHSTHNPFVIRTGTTILQLFKASIGKSVQDHPQVALEDHKRIFAAFCKKDQHAVKKAIMKSFERWKAFLEGEITGDHNN
jgi:GntR family transcriptional repressor for pyruvate dehydrogenase complex